MHTVTVFHNKDKGVGSQITEHPTQEEAIDFTNYCKNLWTKVIITESTRFTNGDVKITTVTFIDGVFTAFDSQTIKY